MVETGKPPENGEARETGIPATFLPWPNEIDDLGSEVLREAVERIEAPLEAADLELLDRLQSPGGGASTGSLRQGSEALGEVTQRGWE